MLHPSYNASLPLRLQDALDEVHDAAESLTKARELGAFAYLDPRHQKQVITLTTTLRRHVKHLQFLYMESTKAVKAFQEQQPELIPTNTSKQPHLL